MQVNLCLTWRRLFGVLGWSRQGGGKGTGVASPAVASESTWGGGGLGGKGRVDQFLREWSLWKAERGGDR